MHVHINPKIPINENKIYAGRYELLNLSASCPGTLEKTKTPKAAHVCNIFINFE